MSTKWTIKSDLDSMVGSVVLKRPLEIAFCCRLYHNFGIN